jgi:exonuclease I
MYCLLVIIPSLWRNKSKYDKHICKSAMLYKNIYKNLTVALGLIILAGLASCNNYMYIVQCYDSFQHRYSTVYFLTFNPTFYNVLILLFFICVCNNNCILIQGTCSTIHRFIYARNVQLYMHTAFSAEVSKSFGLFYQES